MENQAVIQVLEKQNYTKQHLVSLPSQLESLGPSTARVKSSLISLTTNNLTYARLGELLGWYGVHPLPPSIPKEFSDSAKYGRIAAWGYGQVIESNFDGAPAGSFVFGYLPIGTLPVDLRFNNADVEGQVVETSKHRQHLMPIYNRYLIVASLSETDRETYAYDSLLEVLFETGYNMSQTCLAFGKRKPTHPLGEPYINLGMTQTTGWSESDADIANAVVIILAASGKTALSFAHQLRQARPSTAQPRQIIGLTSPSSKPFVEGTKFYDQVFVYDADPSSAGVKASDKVVLCDFGGRGSATAIWLGALKPNCKELIWLGIGGESKLLTAGEVAQLSEQAGRFGMLQVNASGLRDAAMKEMGEAQYWEGFLSEWKAFKDAGGIPGLKFKFARGMDAVEKTWDKICEGGMKPDEGDIFEL